MLKYLTNLLLLYYICNVEFIQKILFSYNFFLYIEKLKVSNHSYALLPIYVDFDLKVATCILYNLGCKMYSKKVN